MSSKITISQSSNVEQNLERIIVDLNNLKIRVQGVDRELTEQEYIYFKTLVVNDVKKRSNYVSDNLETYADIKSKVTPVELGII